ncbi:MULTISPECIES: GntR family transcriptional regulator [Vibrio]|uniref:GntR family transcriptional regulator n=2 Tax=Vibrio TaxID=662 RepID=A0A7X4RUR2_9VIBR|nr:MULTISPECIES: GntR family transcriptional regulator [Vibrio]MBF9002605.1 GntR family transcriptional regulator [Vibrio nitrifigilis]MZI93369.1 GntR family transcriptional regulator [Vibrio eleionomae]
MSNDDKIYQKILTAIVEHQLPPGERLPEDKLSEAFGVSRTGIRKVLQRLALERFVVIQPNKGAHVNRPTRQESEEVLDSRIMLESLLIPSIAQQWTKKQSRLFRTMVEQEKQADLDKDMAKSIRLTAQFHYELAYLGHNQIIAEFIEQLCYRSSLVIAAYGSRDSVCCDSSDHVELLDLFDQGNVEQAQAWMTRHLTHVKESINLEGSNDGQVDFHQLFSDTQKQQ